MRTNLQNCVRVLAIAGSLTTAAFAAERAIKVDDRLDASADALTDMMRASDHGIPQDLIDKARCVVVIPGMKKPDSSLVRSLAADLPFVENALVAGARRPRCARKAVVSDFRLALPTPRSYCW